MFLPKIIFGSSAPGALILCIVESGCLETSLFHEIFPHPAPPYWNAFSLSNGSTGMHGCIHIREMENRELQCKLFPSPLHVHFICLQTGWGLYCNVLSALLPILTLSRNLAISELCWPFEFRSFYRYSLLSN